MLVLKIRCLEEIRRISLEKDPTFNELVATLKKLFDIDPNSNEEFMIKYVDEDEDLITIATDIDLSEALRVYYEQKMKLLQLFLTKYLLTAEQMEQKKKKLADQASSVASTPSSLNNTTNSSPSTSTNSSPSIPESPKDTVVQPSPPVLSVDDLAKRLDTEPAPTKEDTIAQPIQSTPVVHATESAPINTETTTNDKEKSTEGNKQEDIEWVEFKTRTGKTVYLNLKAGSLSRYGIEPFTRVNTRKGPATVYGIDRDRGYLWFQLDKDPGVSFWDDIVNYDSLVAKGVTIMENQTQHHQQQQFPSIVNTSPSTSASTSTSNPATAPVNIPKPTSPLNNNNYTAAKPTTTTPTSTSTSASTPPSARPIWNAERAAEYGFTPDDDEAKMIELALRESLKTK